MMKLRGMVGEEIMEEEEEVGGEELREEGVLRGA